MRTDGVDCKESAGTWLLVFKEVRVTGAAFSDFTTDLFMCLSFSTQIIGKYLVVDMWNKKTIYRRTR